MVRKNLFMSDPVLDTRGRVVTKCLPLGAPLPFVKADSTELPAPMIRGLCQRRQGRIRQDDQGGLCEEVTFKPRCKSRKVPQQETSGEKNTPTERITPAKI